MFLSSTDQSSPNNPSSSSNFLHLINSTDEFGPTHVSNISIRDYAFSNRAKNINKSWPFSPKSLQLCLKHGISDPLPPFQPRGTVISHPTEAWSLEKPNTTHVEVEAISQNLEQLGFNQISAEAREGFENGLLAATTSNSKTQVATVKKNRRKKCGLIVKPGGACVDSGAKEDNSCVSETMALMRTCPICKTFSSASNTTLNAHIDQCLSVDSEEQPVSKPSRPRTKPPQPRLKVKSMVDIYATAKPCTLQDLDNRNGTNWSMVSSYSNRVDSDSEPEASNKEKKKKRSVLPVRTDHEDDAAGIGPVYIDAKGQKLRILSEPSREHEDVSDSDEKKSSSEGKGSYKRFRKRVGRKKYSSKQRKPVPQSRKRTVRKGKASEIPEDQRGDFEEGSGMERSETPGPSQRKVTKRRLSRKEKKKGKKVCDQLSENGDSLSGDSLVLRGPSHASTDLSETVSSPLTSQNSWRICGESQVSGKSWALPKRKSTESSIPVDKVFASEAKGLMKLKKARLDFSEDEDEDDGEDTGKWESEMTQERELAEYEDWDGGEETDKVLRSSNPSISGEDSGYESYDDTDTDNGDDDMLDKTNDADAEFESMMYEKTGCETAEGGSSFMAVDPIPIPGPPGSFLPSPWDMGTDDAVENHGNSSVITSQVQSPQDQLDLTDRNSSEPVSNFAAPESFGQPPPHMIRQDLDLLSKSVPTIPSNSNSVLRLMGKDLVVTKQRVEASFGNLSLKPNSQSLEPSKTQQLSPPVHHRPYGGNGLYSDTNASFFNIP